MATLEETNALTLPVVTLDTPLRAAFDVMRTFHRSGILAEEHEEFFLFTAATVVIGIARAGDATLRQLPQRTLVYPLFDQPAGDTGFPGKDQFREWLAKLGGRYAVFHRAAGKAKILTDSEELRQKLESSPRDCYCEIDEYPVPNGSTGGNCGTLGHPAGSVRCV